MLGGEGTSDDDDEGGIAASPMIEDEDIVVVPQETGEDMHTLNEDGMLVDGYQRRMQQLDYQVPNHPQALNISQQNILNGLSK